MRCPYLEYIGSGKSVFGDTSDDYICNLTGQTMDLYSKKVEYTCDRDAHEDCPIYKNR